MSQLPDFTKVDFADTPVPGADASVTYGMIPDIGQHMKALSFFIFVGCVATLTVACLGVFFVTILALPFSILGLFDLTKLLFTGIMWASPVTLGLLPVFGMLVRRRRTATHFVLPIVGLAGGYLTMLLWFPGHSGSPSTELFLWTGALAGFAAGGIFLFALHEVRR